MICPNCGNDMPDDMTLCRHCAAVVHKKTVYISKKKAESGCRKVISIKGTAPITLDIFAGIKSGEKIMLRNAVFTYPDGKQKKELVIVTVRIGMHRALKAFLWLYAAVVLAISGYMIALQAEAGNIPFLNDLLKKEERIYEPPMETENPGYIDAEAVFSEEPEETPKNWLPYGEEQMQIYADFLAALEGTLQTTDPAYNHFQLYDFDADFLPELVVKTGTSEEDAVYSVYTIKSDIVVKIGEIPAKNGVLCASGSFGGLLFIYSEEDVETIELLRVENGKAILESIYRGKEYHAMENPSLVVMMHYAITDRSMEQDGSLSWRGNPFYDNAAIFGDD